MRCRIWCWTAMTALAILGFVKTQTWAADPVAYITEIQRGANGEVRVKLVGEADWRLPQPLLGLRPGDQVRATGDARVVILRPHGGTPQTVTATNSPLTVAGSPSPGGATQVGGAMAWLVQSMLVKSFLGIQGAPREVQGGVRSMDRRPPEAEVPSILSPRETRVFPGQPIFEWEGGDQLRYTVRVRGREGLLWEEGNLPRRPIRYPTTAPPLRPAARYEWELLAAGHRAQRSYFDLLSESEALRIREALTTLEGVKSEGYPPATVTVMRAAILFNEGLFQEARRDLGAALTVHPNEPTLHFLLGRVYAATGLHSRAAEAFEQAQSLGR